MRRLAVLHAGRPSARRRPLRRADAAGRPTAIDQADSPPDQLLPQRPGALFVGGVRPAAGAAKDSDLLELAAGALRDGVHGRLGGLAGCAMLAAMARIGAGQWRSQCHHRCGIQMLAKEAVFGVTPRAAACCPCASEAEGWSRADAPIACWC